MLNSTFAYKHTHIDKIIHSPQKNRRHFRCKTKIVLKTTQKHHFFQYYLHNCSSDVFWIYDSTLPFCSLQYLFETRMPSYCHITLDESSATPTSTICCAILELTFPCKILGVSPRTDEASLNCSMKYIFSPWMRKIHNKGPYSYILWHVLLICLSFHYISIFSFSSELKIFVFVVCDVYYCMSVCPSNTKILFQIIWYSLN